MRLLIRC